jgi:hypothetical protein
MSVLGELALPCASCGHPVKLRAARFLGLSQAGELPLCGECRQAANYLCLDDADPGVNEEPKNER